MSTRTMSRRAVLETGVCAMGATAVLPGIAAHAGTGPSPKTEEISPKTEETIRKYYAAWEKRDWHPIDILLADNFTFTSANNDDHISKSTFKTRCWESQIDFIQGFELERVIAKGNEAFVMYRCRTRNGKTFRNVEYFQLSDHKVESIECYFGGPSSFPSAVSTGQS